MTDHRRTPAETWTTRQLVDAGMTRSQIAWAVGRGRLLRIRIGHYALPDIDVPTQQAVRVGGRLTCVSELRRLGVWVTHPPVIPHVHLLANASRLRDPHDMTRRWTPMSEVRLHWDRLIAEPSEGRVAALDAVLQAFECLPLADAVASFDSAAHLGIVDPGLVRSSLPAHHAPAAGLVDGTAESGLETLVVFSLRTLGMRLATQVVIPGVGRVDAVVEGWVAVETDGRQFHEPVAPRDRRRDARAAGRRVTPLRFDYAQVVYERDDVLRAILGAVLAHRNVRGSGRGRALRALRLLKAQIS